VDLTDAEVDAILERWPVARLATLADDGRPELVPIVFARSNGALWSALDGKPKRGRELARVRNLRRDSRVCLLLDHYDPDWRALWWLRLDARAEVVDAKEQRPEVAHAVAALRAKYPQYASGVALFSGEPTLLRFAIERRVSWRASTRAPL
jgi:PPOX class probable F420-dependent enzyme